MSLARTITRLAAICLVAIAAHGCRPEQTPAVAPARAVETTIWSWLGDAPAWFYVDLVALRTHPGVVAAWDAAGPEADGGPLGAGLATADALVVGWRDPAFSQRVNVLHGELGDTGARQLVEDGSFTPYTAGRETVWSRPGSPWAIALPDDRTLVTGTPAAVRAAVATPCTECDRAVDATVVGRLRVDEPQRRIAAAVVDSDALDRILASVDAVELSIDLGVGADVVLELSARDGTDLAFAATTLDELVSALGRAADARPDAAIVAALLRRARLSAATEHVQLYLELSRDDVDALIAALTAGFGSDGSGDADAAPTTQPTSEAP